MSFNFMASITICSDFGAPKIKVSHCFPIYLPSMDMGLGGLRELVLEVGSWLGVGRPGVLRSWGGKESDTTELNKSIKEIQGSNLIALEVQQEKGVVKGIKKGFLE